MENNINNNMENNNVENNVENNIENNYENDIERWYNYGNAGADSFVIEEEPSSKKPLIIIALVAVILVILLICGIAVYSSSIFMKPADKILLGMKNSFEGDELTEVFDEITNITNSSAYTLNGDIAIPDSSSELTGMSLTLSQDRKNGMQSASGSVSISGYEYTFNECMDDEKVQFTLPKLTGDTLLVYPYTTKKTGYICQLAEQEDFDKIDAALKVIHSASTFDSEKAGEVAIDAFRKDFESLNFVEEKDAKPVTIGDSEVKGKVYTAVMSADFINSTISDINSAYDGEYLNNVMDVTEKYRGQEGKDFYADLMELFNVDAGVSQSCKTEFVLNGKNLVGITITPLDASGNELSEHAIEFKFTGTDIPWHNTEISGRNFAVCMTAKVDNGTETITIGTNEENLAEFAYNINTGNFSLGTKDTGLQDAMITGLLKSDADGFRASVFNADDLSKVNLTLSSGADIQTPTAGTTVNLATMTEKEYTQLASIIFGNLLAGMAY